MTQMERDYSDARLLDPATGLSRLWLSVWLSRSGTLCPTAASRFGTEQRHCYSVFAPARFSPPPPVTRASHRNARQRGFGRSLDAVFHVGPD
jgi:hypothetical protein